MIEPINQAHGERGPEQGDAADSDIRHGLIIIGLLVLVFIIWAALARLDAASLAPGQVVVVGQRQAVQHRTGGTVHTVAAREGAFVRLGDPLVELVGTEERESERSLAEQKISLEAQRARLMAELADSKTINWPDSFQNPSPEDADAIRTAKTLQLTELSSGRAALGAQLDGLRQQERRAMESASGYSGQIASSREQARLVEEELSALAPVAEKGFVSRSRLRALERAKAELVGRMGEYRANAAQSSTAASERRIQRAEILQLRRQRSVASLRETEFALTELSPRYRVARDLRERLMIRAPQDGTIVGLSVFNAGSLVAPGQRILDLVPKQARLEIQARVPLEDGDDLRPGQSVEVRFTGLHDRGLPVLNGNLKHFSADSLIDEKTGQGFYLATVQLPEDQIALIRQVRGADFRPRPGAPVLVMIPTRSRSALQYLLEPLTDMVWRSFRQP